MRRTGVKFGFKVFQEMTWELPSLRYQSTSYQTTGLCNFALIIYPYPSRIAIPHRHLCQLHVILTKGAAACALMSRRWLCGTIGRVLFAVEIRRAYLVWCCGWPLGWETPGWPGSRISRFAMANNQPSHFGNLGSIFLMLNRPSSSTQYFPCKSVQSIAGLATVVHLESTQ